MSDVAHMVVEIRRILGFNLSRLAEILGVSQGAISKWIATGALSERHKPTPDNLQKLGETYRKAQAVKLGALIVRNDGAHFDIVEFESSCNVSRSYPHGFRSDARQHFNALLLTTGQQQREFQIRVMISPLPADVDAYIQITPQQDPRAFVIVVSDSLTLEERRNAIRREFLGHVLNRLVPGTDTTTPVEESNPHYGSHD